MRKCGRQMLAKLSKEREKERAKTDPYPKASHKKPKRTPKAESERADLETEEEEEEKEEGQAPDEPETELEPEPKSETKPRHVNACKKTAHGPYSSFSPRKLKPSKPKSKPGPETEPDSTPDPEPKPSKKSKSRTGKDSHLYTDDNPATTLHGTGFKDAATARHTIELVQKRSLLYQFQTINTMYNRAKHHPHSSNNKDMQAAMAIFREWLDETYPAAKDAQIDFKPLLRRDVVEKYLPALKNEGVVTKWAEMYIALPKGKRLANVLMDDEKPDEADMAKVRQDVLEELVSDRGDAGLPGKNDDHMWNQHAGISSWHLKLVAYGWSPVTASVLLKSFEATMNNP